MSKNSHKNSFPFGNVIRKEKAEAYPPVPSAMTKSSTPEPTWKPDPYPQRFSLECDAYSGGMCVLGFSRCDLTKYEGVLFRSEIKRTREFLKLAKDFFGTVSYRQDVRRDEAFPMIIKNGLAVMTQQRIADFADLIRDNLTGQSKNKLLLKVNNMGSYWKIDGFLADFGSSMADSPPSYPCTVSSTGGSCYSMFAIPRTVADRIIYRSPQFCVNSNGPPNPSKAYEQGDQKGKLDQSQYKGPGRYY